VDGFGPAQVGIKGAEDGFLQDVLLRAAEDLEGKQCDFFGFLRGERVRVIDEEESDE
jgi:hypothetical protein